MVYTSPILPVRSLVAFCSLRFVALMVMLIIGLGGLTTEAIGQMSPKAIESPSAASLMDHIADVVIFVKPISADTASIGVSYNSRVNHDHVKTDLANLLLATGWVYGGGLKIDDASAHPDQLKAYPVTTGAMLTVTKAPQVLDSAPSLLPYLQAFHAYSYVEVNFALPDLHPYNGVTHFVSKALNVELHKDQGVYRYETEILDHQNQLPELVSAARVEPGAGTINGREVTAQSRPARPGRAAGTMVVLGSILILAGIGIYTLMARRDTKTVPIRSTLRR